MTRLRVTQTPLFMPESAWTPPPPDTWPTWPQHGRVSVDIETKDPDLKELGPGWARPENSHVVGVAITIEDGPSLYLPMAHEGGDNVADTYAAWRYLRTEAKNFKGTLINHHISYDLLWLAANDVTFPNVTMIRDTEIAEVVLDDLAIQYNLERCCQKHDLEGKDETLLYQAAGYFSPERKGRGNKVGNDRNPKANLWRYPARFVGPYAEQDTRAVLKLARRQEREIDRAELWEIYNLESSVIPVVVAMTRRGIAVSEEKLDAFETWASERRERAVDRLNGLTGASLHVSELSNTAAIAKALLKVPGIVLPSTQTGTSVSKESLSPFKGSPAVQAYQEAKKYDTAIGKFVVGTRKCLVNGRIHATFNQSKRETGDGSIAGAISGRLSCSNPNLQNQPSRDKVLAKPWRSIYVPDGGGQWAACDYSEQEPRLTVHYAELLGLRGASDAGDNYRNDPASSLHTMMAQMSGRPRSEAKEIFLGICYGMGKATLGSKLGVTSEEAARVLTQFKSRVPFVSMLADRCKQKAERGGFVKTILGRRLHFPLRSDGRGAGFDYTHKALNRVIQGGAADQTKKAMVDAHNAGLAIQLQVHDELGLTVQSIDQSKQLADIMERAVELRVPSRVSVKTGPSWGEAV